MFPTATNINYNKHWYSSIALLFKPFQIVNFTISHFRMTPSSRILFLRVVGTMLPTLFLLVPVVEAFHPTNQQMNRMTSLSSSSLRRKRFRTTTATPIPLESSQDDNNVNEEIFDSDTLKERLQQLQLQILEEEMKRPPTNSALSPIEVVQEIMNALLHSYDPFPDSGFKLLLKTATPKWRTAILNSVGAKSTTTNIDLVASALGSSMERPNNQFAILVGEGEEYILDFSPSDPLLDFGDGTCWVECRLRDKHTNELLVMTGWDLCQQQTTQQQQDDVSSCNNSPWLVDGVYWQDFRDEFRPGIGREEWLVEVS